MKRYLLVMMLLVCSVTLHAQQEATRFLGIPVDGKKSVMIQKLKEKGFTNNAYNKDVLVGMFNGNKVNVHIVTNNDKVCRIMVCDVSTMNAGDIKIRFNRLCQQFQKNGKYIPASSSDYTLPEDENIPYEMTVHHKRYEAAYYQLPSKMDSTVIADKIAAGLIEKFSEDELKKPTKKQREEIENFAVSYLLDKCSNSCVWFMISSEYYGKYYITMFYDNENNRANGKDI